jgi:hypothetical protein
MQIHISIPSADFFGIMLHTNLKALKVKLFLLNLIRRHAGSEGIVPLILHLPPRWKWGVSQPVT